MTHRSCKTCGLNESAPFKAIGADDLCVGCRPASAYEGLEEGSTCPECKVGELEDTRDGGCYCHVGNAPCSHCTDLHLYCENCDHEITESY
jgi:hypothetical protein